MRKILRTLFVPIFAIAAFAAGGTVVADAVPPDRITICYNVKTFVVRLAKSRRCGPASRALVIGRGLAGPRGPQGPRGPAGPAGAVGGTGSTGGSGAVGPAGGTGVMGGTGGTGPAGVNTFHTVTATSTLNNGPLTSSCLAGEVVTGGGFFTSSSASAVDLTDSAPTPQRDGWRVQYSGGPTISVTVYAICVAGVNT